MVDDLCPLQNTCMPTLSHALNQM